MNFLDIVEKRRSYYELTAESTISDEQLQQLVERAVKHAPSAFNSQSSRVVLLKGSAHKELWGIVMETLRKIVPEDAFAGTKKKINSFAAAYGTVLYFEDQDVVESLQKQFPAYETRFPEWSGHHTGLLQFIIWTALEEAGMGANLQHYNPLIDDEIKGKWGLSQSWKLIAQMPFGKSSEQPGAKEFAPMEERLRIFG